MLTSKSNPILHNQWHLCPFSILECWGRPADLAASFSLIHCKTRVGFFAFEQTFVRKFVIQLWNSAWSGNFQMHLLPLWVQVPIPAAWLVTDLRQDFFPFAFPEKHGEGMDCNDFSHPLFSIPSLLWIPDDAVKFLELLCISSDTRRASWQSKTLLGILISSSVFRCILDSRLGFLQLEGIRAWIETWALSKLLGESGPWKIFESSVNSNRSRNYLTWSPKETHCSRFLILLHRIFIQRLSSYSILFYIKRSSRFFKFLGNVLHSIPGEHGSSTPIHYISVSLTLSLICPLIDFRSLSSLRFKLSSRLDQCII